MRNEQGFSLVSVLIAVVILTIGILALAKTTTTVVRASSRAATRSEAVNIARAYMEEVRSRPPANLVSEGVAMVDRDGVVNASGPYTRQVVVQILATNLRSVQVLVTMPNTSVPVELVTLAFVGSF